MVSFDPYKLLHINNDGAFNTTAIYNSFDRLDVKYNPNVIRAKNSVQGAKKVPMDKAIKRYENLQKAFATLTQEDLFSNYLKYGTPDGSKVIYALNLAVPYWILGEEMRPMLVTWAFVGCIVIGLGFKVWWNSNPGDKCRAGIEKDSKVSMKEFMVAILEDNPKAERTIGFSDSDIIEIYQQSMEIGAFDEHLIKKTTFVDVVKWMI